MVVVFAHQVQEELGQLLISRRTPTEEYGAHDRELLKQLGDQASTIVYGLRRDAELVTARQEAVASAAEVRAQLGRDLHDQFAPLLAGAGLTAEALRRGFEPGSPDEASATRLAERLRSGEARRFAHDLQPAALTDANLIAAVHDWIDSLHGDALPTIELYADNCELPQAANRLCFHCNELHTARAQFPAEGGPCQRHPMISSLHSKSRSMGV